MGIGLITSYKSKHDKKTKMLLYKEYLHFYEYESFAQIPFDVFDYRYPRMDVWRINSSTIVICYGLNKLTLLKKLE